MKSLSKASRRALPKGSIELRIGRGKPVGVFLSPVKVQSLQAAAELLGVHLADALRWIMSDGAAYILQNPLAARAAYQEDHHEQASN